ncbi:MAG TPA: response regulator [Chitinophagales bacterium]|nr:response regulator [Chitinophagales bacterium]
MQPKILLVDDREDNLLSIEAILGSDGYRFMRANSGRQALKILLQEFDFALILMDVQMPNLNGFETASLIYEREKLKHIPIIFITAHNYGDENIYKGYRAGAVDYIYKPINPELLRAKVAIFVELYQKTHRLIAQEQKLIAINRNLEAEISERKSSEEKVNALNLQLLQNIDKLEDANKDLDRFAFMASHDLQEPLRKIRTFTDLLFNKYHDAIHEDGKKYLDKIQQAAQRMQTLIQDILTFSKVSVENKEFIESNMSELLNHVLEEMKPMLQAKNAHISVDPLPLLKVNPVLIHPLFFNLISNAIKYSKKDVPPEIKIYSDRDSQPENKYCRIFFEDNGIGFDQKYAEQIFLMFKRLHHNSEYEGTGIGLALCKKIVEEHKGFISARSKENEGSVFIVSLPMNGNQSQTQKESVRNNPENGN